MLVGNGRRAVVAFEHHHQDLGLLVLLWGVPFAINPEQGEIRQGRPDRQDGIESLDTAPGAAMAALASCRSRAAASWRALGEGGGPDQDDRCERARHTHQDATAYPADGDLHD